MATGLRKWWTISDGHPLTMYNEAWPWEQCDDPTPTLADIQQLCLASKKCLERRMAMTLMQSEAVEQGAWNSTLNHVSFLMAVIKTM